jgi:hypothetical protein
MKNIFYIPVLMLSVLQSAGLNAQTTVILNPDKDNTLYESVTGDISNGSGTELYTGTTNTNSKRRILIRFNIGVIPAGATITAATLTLTVDKTSSGAENTSIHRVTSDWGEGASVATGGGGGGAVAQTNDATWLNTFFPSSLWTNPGGDYATATSATTSVNGNGIYTWSSPQVIADIQSWLDSVNPNYGWIILGNESTSRTTKRMISRESGNTASRPRLSLTYTVPCVAPGLPSLFLQDTLICIGGTTFLNISGNLNSAAAWQVYAGGCGTTSLGSDSSGIFHVNPDSSTTYYVRGEGNCVTPGTCSEITLSVKAPEDPSFSYSSNNFCQSANNPVPIVTGLSGGSFSSSPAGLAINTSTGAINLSASTPGINYSVTYTTPGPVCQDSANVFLSVQSNYTENQTLSICHGDSVVLGSQVLKTAGTYQEIFQASGGCDSTVNLALTVLPVFSSSYSAAICDGDSILFGSQTLKSPGAYQETLKSVNGCDSTVNLALTVLPVIQNSFSESICDGDSILFGTNYIRTPGTYTEVFKSSSGCDSTVILTLSLKQRYDMSINAEICAGSSYVFGTQNLTANGTYTEVFTASSGCDSTVTLTLNVFQPDTTVSLSGVTLTSGAVGATYQWLNCGQGNAIITGETGKDYVVQQSGNYSVLITQNGCADTSSCLSVIVLGITEKTGESGIKIFPNPSKRIVSIDLGRMYKKINISISNSDGKIILERSFKNQDKIQLDLSENYPGMYYVMVNLNQKTSVLKLIIE